MESTSKDKRNQFLNHKQAKINILEQNVKFTKQEKWILDFNTELNHNPDKYLVVIVHTLSLSILKRVSRWHISK